MPSRREFLANAMAVGGVLSLGADSVVSGAMANRASKPLRILILGGTGFIGPYHVRAAVARGHHVSAFVRSHSHAADLPEGVEPLFGDRNGDLESIRNREWDAALDLATYGPGWVKSLGEALQGRVQHYTFISTISVYDTPGYNLVTTEQSKVSTYDGQDDPYSITTPGQYYGALKVLCEREAEKQFAGKTLVLRPGYIVGPGDPQDALTYWPMRMRHGGEVLVAGDPFSPVQFIDVRDLAEWCVRMVEQRATGVYNAVGPAAPLNFSQLVKAAGREAPAHTHITWASAPWLSAQTDRSAWSKLLFWTYEPGGFAGTMRMSSQRALAAGLKVRPVEETLTATLKWFSAQPAERQALTGYQQKADGTWDKVVLPWSEYLECERKILADWRRVGGARA